MTSTAAPSLTLQTHFLISSDPLSVDQAYTLASHEGNGSVVLMSGTVRNQTGGRAVDYLEYQAYQPMALQIFAQIGQQIQAHWPQTNTLVIHHRVGSLAINEISVVVAVGTPHRTEGFAACQYAIDTLKHQAPIWKKEYWRDGESEWVKGYS